MEIVYKVTATPSLRIRSSPSITATQVGSLSTNSQVAVTQLTKSSDGYTWGKHSKGWSSISSPTGANYMIKVGEISGPSNKTVTTPAKTISQTKTEPETDTVQTVQNKSVSYNILTNTKFTLQSARSIMGLPAQFSNVTDPRVPGSAFGRTYTENILMDLPLCTIIPGGPKFLTGKNANKDTRTGLLNVLLHGGDSSASGNTLGDIVDKILNGNVARYYSFESQYNEYMEYVNSLNRVLAFYLGIQDIKGISNTAYKALDWKNINVKESTGIQDFIGNYGSVSFYYDRSGTGASESASNSTDRSMLDGVMQTASSAAKEAAFLTQSFSGKEFDMFNAEAQEKKINSLSLDLSSNQSMVSQIMTNLKSGFTTVASGSNLLLPEIWKDSSFSRSYSLDFHFASPYGTKEAYFLNIGVPVNFLLSTILPRQFGANGYSSPFLIQVFAQGLFNCSLGIVESISISKFGSGDAISREYLPLEVKVSISFKDLYSSLALTVDKNTAMFANNIELIDYIATMAGVNLNEPDIKRKMRLFIESKMNTIRDIPGNIKGKIYDKIRNSLMGMLKY